MIYNHEHLAGKTTIDAEICVIGSGAGGGPVAYTAAKAGRRVVVIEAGSFLRPREMTQLENEMFPQLYHDKGGRTTTDQAVHVHQGKGVGGSTLHNLNLCERVPDGVLAHWAELGGGPTLQKSALDALYHEAETLLSVTQMGEIDLNPNNRMFRDGVVKLGYRGSFLRHNRKGCAASGFCELGCPFDAKQNSLKVFIAPAVREGLMVLCDTWALRATRSGRRLTTLEAIVRHPVSGAPIGEVRVNAKVFCFSASATGTPTLIQRSELPDPHRLVGSRLHLHPASVVAGLFPQKLESWKGRPQSYQCTELLEFSKGSNKRVWLVPAFAHPAGVSSILPGFGFEHQRYMEHYPQMAAVTAMVHDETRGRVKPKGRFGVAIDYWPDEADRQQIVLGLVASAKILLAAGATKVVVPTVEPIELQSASDANKLASTLTIERYNLNITAVHPMSSVWMGERPETSCVDPSGRYHQLDNLFVADTSLYPTSIGGPPQLTAYALGLHVGRRLVASLG